ncbi:DUF4340 domain-containing protein [Prosthecobacter sp. SYSU 5D2]|uniref:DUF4340 domain-containing protein n=1 Tax=Prosthecobacter sp. SYSU 5D2 TaxID=3134134 RepID=UPI0031FE78DF
MKKILILFIILAGLVAAAVVYQNQQNATLNTAASRGVKSRERLLPDLDILAVKKLRIKDAKSELNITIDADGKSAKVAERDGYPASLDRISSILTELYDQRIASKQEVRKGAWAEIEVQPPGEGNEGVGTLVELLGEGDKLVKSLILGKQIDITGGRSSTQFDGGNQRFVRIPEDGDTIWVVSNTFFSLEPSADTWLDKSFLDVQRVKEVSVTFPDDRESWRVVRKDDVTNDFTLLDAKPGEALDNSKLSVYNLLSSPVFNDVISKEKGAELLKDAIKVKIVTFDGFTYDLLTTKQTKDGTDRFFLTVDVSADIPKTRPPVADEKEEDKKKADEEFAAKKKTLEEKLAKEKKFANWVYEVSEYTVNNVHKKRSEIVKVEAKATPAPATTPEAPAAPAPDAPVSPVTAPEAPAASKSTPAPATNETPAAPAAGADSLNPQPPSVTTPPIQIPAAPASEIKPEADPEAAPQVQPQN